MERINQTDRLFVTISQGGINICSIETSGISTLSEVYKKVKSQANIDAGVVTLRLRNSTQGWTQQHNLVLKKAKGPKQYSSIQIEQPYPSLFD